jgi:hypothetical protein
MIRILTFLAGIAFLAGCTAQDLDEAPVPLGDFKLGHNVVIASKARQGPVSRDATEAEWEVALEQAIDDRFGRYEGEGLYHFGISVEGYMLAPGGVPLIYTPKSALIVNVTVWDDDDNRKLNGKPHQMTIFENTDEESVLLGSGLGRTKQEQLDGLAYNMAKGIEVWLEQQYAVNRWFTDDAVFDPPPLPRDTEER